MALNNPLDDAVQDPVIYNQAYQGLQSDNVKMEGCSLASDQANKGPDPVYQDLPSNQANKGLDPVYQDLPSCFGRPSVNEQKPAGDNNYY